MNNILAAKILISHLPEITDGAYKTAIEVAIETLCDDAILDWARWYQNELNLRQYLGFNESDYDRWIVNMGKEYGMIESYVEDEHNDEVKNI